MMPKGYIFYEVHDSEAEDYGSSGVAEEEGVGPFNSEDQGRALKDLVETFVNVTYVDMNPHCSLVMKVKTTPKYQYYLGDSKHPHQATSMDTFVRKIDSSLKKHSDDKELAPIREKLEKLQQILDCREH